MVNVRLEKCDLYKICIALAMSMTLFACDSSKSESGDTSEPGAVASSSENTGELVSQNIEEASSSNTEESDSSNTDESGSSNSEESSSSKSASFDEAKFDQSTWQ